MKKNKKSFLAMALCAAMTLSTAVVPAFANTNLSNTNISLSDLMEHFDYKDSEYSGVLTEALNAYIDQTTTLDEKIHTWLDENGYDGLSSENRAKILEIIANDITVDRENFTEVVNFFNEYVEKVSKVQSSGSYFNEVSKLMVTNANVPVLFDAPYKDHGYMDNYLSYVYEGVLPGDHINANGYNKNLVNNRVIQVPLGTTMSVPASTALEMRYLSGDGSSIASLQTSNLKHFSLSSVIYNLVSNNVVGHFYPQVVGSNTYVTFENSGMYLMYAQPTALQTTTVNNLRYYTDAQLKLMLQYSTILIASNDGLPFSWYLPNEGQNFNYIGTIVSPVVGSVAIPSTGIMHTVEAGDTLYTLAKKYYGSELFVNKVYNANVHRIADQTALIVGQQVYLPK